jgi:hypothetical protein
MYFSFSSFTPLLSTYMVTHPYISYIFIHLVKLHSYEQHPDCNLISVNRVITIRNFGQNLEETLLKKYNKHKI